MSNEPLSNTEQLNALMAVEVWKPMYANYRISNKGRIYSKFVNRVIRPSTTKTGYLNISLKVVDRHGVWYSKNMLVHRLVLSHFLSNPDVGQECDHIDGDRQNNNLENLRWVTAQENTNNRVRLGNVLKGEEVQQSKLTEVDVERIIQLYDFGIDKTTISKSYGVVVTTISNIINGKTWKHIDRKAILKAKGIEI